MRKIGVVLGGGGAKGLAHIGFLKVLDELRLRPAAVSGCSMGSIIGALYCMGKSGKDIERIANEITIKEVFKMASGKGAKNRRLEEVLNKLFEGKRFEDLQIPLYVNSVDIDTGEEVIFNKGDLARAVRASISLPFIFRPAIINGRALVDGGVKDNLPIEALDSEMLDGIIAVDVGSINMSGMTTESTEERKRKRKSPSLIKAFGKSLAIMQSNEHIVDFYKKKSDLLITPNLERYSIIDFGKRKKIIAIGEKVAREVERKIVRIFRYKIRGKTMARFFDKQIKRVISKPLY